MSGISFDRERPMMHFQNVPTAVSKDTAAGVLFLKNAGFATDF